MLPRSAFPLPLDDETLGEPTSQVGTIARVDLEGGVAPVVTLYRALNLARIL
jgi:hypothetical protein